MEENKYNFLTPSVLASHCFNKLKNLNRKSFYFKKKDLLRKKIALSKVLRTVRSSSHIYLNNLLK